MDRRTKISAKRKLSVESRDLSFEANGEKVVRTKKACTNNSSLYYCLAERPRRVLLKL